MEKKSCNLGTRKHRHASGPRNLKEFGVSGMKACSGAHFGVFFAEIKGKMGATSKTRLAVPIANAFPKIIGLLTAYGNFYRMNRSVNSLRKFLQNNRAVFILCFELDVIFACKDTTVKM